MIAVILAGGKGTRLAPYTRIFPKPMMPIGDKAVLEILLYQLRQAGFDEAVLTVGHLAGLMHAFFQDGSQIGLQIRYNMEQQPLGTAGPLAFVEGLDETFLVANGDVLTLLDFNDLVRFHHDQGAMLTIAMHRRKVPIDLGVIEVDGGNRVVGYREKPSLDYLVSMGVYVFEPAVLSYIPKGSYFDFPDLVKTLLAAGEHVSGYAFEGYWQDLGRPDDYEQAIQDFEAMRARFLPGEAR